MNGAGAGTGAWTHASPTGIAYWLLKGVHTQDVIGIVTFDYESYSENVLDKLDDVLNMRWGEWDWKEVTQAEYETYKEFGFEEFKI